MSLAWRNIVSAWRVSGSAVACIALASSVIVGSLTVGASVRTALRNRIVEPLGKTRSARVSPAFFPATEGSILALPASVSTANDLTIPGITLYGVTTECPPAGQVDITPALALDLGVRTGERIFVKAVRSSGASSSTLFGRRHLDDASTEVSATVARIRENGFILSPTFRPPRSVFADRDWLGSALGSKGTANVQLSTATQPPRPLSLAEHGLSLTEATSIRGWLLTSDSILLTAGQIRAAKQAMPGTRRISIGIADRVFHGANTISYATVCWIEGLERTHLVDWAATDLRAEVGSQLTIQGLRPHEDGSYGTVRLSSKVQAIVPIRATDRALVPPLDGLTDEARIDDWDPPFPVDLQRITPRDEAFWDRYRAAPRLFLPEAKIKELWQGDHVTGIWFPHGKRAEIERTLLGSLRPEDSGIALVPLRQNAERAAQGSTDLGSLLLAIGSSVVLSSLALAQSVVRVGVDSRMRQIALLRSLGFSEARVRRILVTEFALLSAIGVVLGVPLGLGFAHAAMGSLQALLPPEIGFSNAGIVVSPLALAAGLTLAFVVSLVGCLPASALIKKLELVPMLRGIPYEQVGSDRSGISLLISVILALGACFVVPDGLRPLMIAVTVLLATVAVGFPLARRLSTRFPLRDLRGGGWGLPAVLLGSASLALAFTAGNLRQSPQKPEYDLLVSTDAPVGIDFSTAQGRRRLGFREESAYEGTTIVRLFRSPGEDASCLNLAKPVEPRIVAVPAGFRPFKTDPPEAWERLQSEPFSLIGEADSVRWTLLSDLGQNYPLGNRQGHFVGLTNGSFLAGDLLVSERTFRTLFPKAAGPTLFLVRSPSPQVTQHALRKDLALVGADVRDTTEELRSYRQVRTAYLALFLALGSFAAIVGVAGSALLQLGKGFRRRRELALLRSLGFSRGRIAVWVAAEGIFAVVLGSVSGFFAVLAGMWSGGGLSPAFAGSALAVVLGVHLCASVAAAMAAARSNPIVSLRSE